LSSAEATPWRSADTPDIAAMVVLSSIRPPPSPTMTEGMTISVSSCPSAGMRLNSTSPARLSTAPATATNRMPIRETSAGARPAPIRMDSPSGR
jgi:hypothetical protein